MILKLLLLLLFILSLDPHPKVVIGQQPATTVINDKCQSVDTPFCNISGHTTSVNPFINSFNHTLSTAIIELNKYVFLLARQPCGMKIKLFLCSLYAPVCVPQEIPDKLLLPCRDDCEEARRVCTADLHAANMTWPEEWSCSKFKYSKHDPLCVINNNSSNETSQSEFNNTPHIGLSTATNGSILDALNIKQLNQPSIYIHSNNNSESTNKTLCSPDLFDCRITDQTEAQKAVCIQMDFVCDSKHDCPRNSDGIGLDEVGCNNDCSADEFYCDFRCINIAKRCDGKADCSDGNDESNCTDVTSFETPFDKYAVICLMVLAIFLLIRCIRKIRCDDQGDVVDMCHESNIVGVCPGGNVVNDMCPSRAISEQDEVLDERESNKDTNHTKLYPRLPTPPFQRLNDHDTLMNMPNYDVPIYQEPNITTGVYERLAVGGHSGASSVYAAYDIDDFDLPAAPPPTPHPIYS